MSTHVSTLDEPADRDAPIGSRPWAIWLVRQARLRREEVERDTALLRDLVAKMRKHEAWKSLGLPSFSALCTTHLRLSEDETQLVLARRSIGGVQEQEER